MAPSEEVAAPVALLEELSIGKSKKGKKGKKNRLAMLDPVPVPEPLNAEGEGEIVPDIPAAPIAAAEAEEAEPRTENGLDLQQQQQQQQQHPDESSSRICASRATHLLIDDEWKKCHKCRALILHLSLELARNMKEENQHAHSIV